VDPVRAAALFRLSRRDFLRAASIGAAACAWPTACIPSPKPRGAPYSPRFFTDAQFATLEALCDRIIPPDSDPGAKQLGAARYIEQLLSAFDGSEVPFVYAGGPTSDRNPYPDPLTGTPSANFPPNSFATPIPLTSLQDLFWRAELYGGAAAGLPDHIEQQWGGTLRGLRDIYVEGLGIVDQKAIAVAGAPFTSLTVDDQDVVLAALDHTGVFPNDPVRGMTFLDLVIQHTIEGCFSAPEYGGNAGGAGWRMIGLEGDSQPLGYAIYTSTIDDMTERPDHPLSTANPDELSGGTLAPKPLTADGAGIQNAIASYTGFLETLVPGSCS
jgi:hypothetical protein